MSTVVVVDGALRLRGVLEDVYGALRLDWDPATVGSIADESPGATTEVVEAGAARRATPSGTGLSDAIVRPDELAAAAAQIDRYRSLRGPPGPARRAARADDCLLVGAAEAVARARSL